MCLCIRLFIYCSLYACLYLCMYVEYTQVATPELSPELPESARRPGAALSGGGRQVEWGFGFRV